MSDEPGPASSVGIHAHTPDDPRINTPVRLRTSSLTRVDAIAAERDWTRATTIRTLLALGLKAWNRGER